jgi:Ca2+-binding EF-hand superfamily protein
MKKTSRLIVAGTAATLLPFAVVFAQSPDQSAPAQTEQSQQGGATFESLDTDGDGRISKTEAAANESVTAQFSRYDVNGDGFIERAEVGQANESQSQTPADTPQPQPQQ